MSKHIPALMALFLASFAAPGHIWAMGLSYTTTLDDDGAEDVTRGHGAVTVELNPGSDGFTHTFTAPTHCCVLSGSDSTGYGFYDDYLFKTDSGSVSPVPLPASLPLLLSGCALTLLLGRRSGENSFKFRGNRTGERADRQDPAR